MGCTCHQPIFPGSVWFISLSFPLCSIFASNLDVVTAGKATKVLLWKRLECLTTGSLVCAASSPSHLSRKSSSNHHHRSLLCHPKGENKPTRLKVLISLSGRWLQTPHSFLHLHRNPERNNNPSTRAEAQHRQ